MATGRIQTVLGPINPEDCGITLPHEHLTIDTNPVFGHTAPPENLKDIVDIPFTLANLDKLKDHPYFNRDNLYLNSSQEIIEEMKYFKKNGGSTVVDNTTNGSLKRDIKFLHKVARESGVNVIAGAGYYSALVQDHGTLSMTVEDLADVIRKELTDGREGTDIRCGVLGEVGCSWPLQEFEKKNLQASALVQESLGCPATIHPGRNHNAPSEIVRIFSEAGGRVSKLVMSHLDRTIHDLNELAEFAKCGCYCQFDLFGLEQVYEGQEWTKRLIRDDVRVDRIKYLIEEGLDERLTVSTDMHSKHRLMKFGGHGYSHILLNIVPLMLNRGISQREINRILIDNPREWLTFN